MFKKHGLTQIALMMTVLFLSSLMSVAQTDGFDDEGNVNDPAVNERANACFDGGSMADVPCTIEWEWMCGWHLIRWEANNE